MDDVDQALAEFTARRHSSAASKMDALRRVEALTEPGVLPFLLEVVADIQELPEVRAHMIKALRIRHVAADADDTFDRLARSVLSTWNFQ